MLDFAWIVTIVSIIGAVANIFKKKWCFVIWMLSNTYWFVDNISTGRYAQAALFFVYFILAVAGLVTWTEPKEDKTKMRANGQAGEAV